MNTTHNKMVALPHRCAGLTLIEVMVAIVIAIILLVVTVSVFVGNKRSYTEQDEMGRLQENARYAMDTLSQDIRQAGYTGCADEVTVVHDHTNSGFDFTNIIEGLDSSELTPTWHPLLNAAPPIAPGGGDGIALHYIKTNLLDVNVDMANKSDVVSVNVLNQDRLPAVGKIVAVTDCTNTDFFKITGLTPATVATYPATVTLQHNNTGNVAVSPISQGGTDPGNCQVTASELCGIYVANKAKVSLGSFLEYRYFIGDDNCSNTGTNRNLCREVAGNRFQIAEGIEHMEILYGVDTTNPGTVPGDKLADTYVPATAVDACCGFATPAENWGRVVSVQIALVARTPDPYGVDLDTKTYQLLDTTFGPMNDRYRRRVFTTTIQLRNRMN